MQGQKHQIAELTTLETDGNLTVLYLGNLCNLLFDLEVLIPLKRNRETFLRNSLAKSKENGWRRQGRLTLFRINLHH